VRRVRAGALALVVTAGLLGGCGSATESAAGVASATTACEQLIGLEQTTENGQINNQVANQTLDSAKINADQAAAEDARWKRLDADISTILSDLVSRQTATLKANVLDVAAICSPLSTTTTTVP